MKKRNAIAFGNHMKVTDHTGKGRLLNRTWAVCVDLVKAHSQTCVVQCRYDQGRH